MESRARTFLPFFNGEAVFFFVLLRSFYQRTPIVIMFTAEQENGKGNGTLPQFPLKLI